LIKSKTIYETPNELRQRNWKIKNVFAEIKKKGNYKRIAVVTHFNIIRHLIAKGFDGDG